MMPIYEYECAVCGTRFERLQQADTTLPRCPSGHEGVRRCFCPPRIIFRGSGFYATDSRRRQPGEEKAA
jgi:putative FmdB family regulatory protein